MRGRAHYRVHHGRTRGRAKLQPAVAGSPHHTHGRAELEAHMAEPLHRVLCRERDACAWWWRRAYRRSSRRCDGL